jgi:uncharacterized protein
MLGPEPRRRAAGITRRSLLAAALRLTLAAPVAGAAGYGYVRAIEPGWVAVERVALTLPNLDPAFDGYRLAQLSDIHMDRWMTGERFRSVVAEVNALAPDLIAITGDFITMQPIAPRLAELVPELRRLAARDGVFAVLGNHDHWTEAADVRAAIREAGATELRNTSRPIRRGEATLHLAGVDDFWVGQANLERILGQLPVGAGAILLAHEPDFADISAPTGRFDLQLSGHSHGGQISVPFAGAPILPTHGPKYPRGPYQVGPMIQYTNRGLGMVEPYGRFGCRPEITLLTLRSRR